MRTYYRNGQEIGMPHNNCDGCSPSMINGIFCHEQGCPDEWRDRKIDCSECGCDFYPLTRYQKVCVECKE